MAVAFGSNADYQGDVPELPRGTRYVAAAAHVAGVPSIEVMEQPFSWSEDFGAIADRWGGCLIGLGGGAENGRLFFVLRFPSCLSAQPVCCFHPLQIVASSFNLGMRNWL